MGLDDFILRTNTINNRGGCCLEHLYFVQLLAMDKEHTHIPCWVKQLRLTKLFDYFIINQNVDKKTILYNFKKNSEHYYLDEIFVNNLNINQFTEFSKLISTPDIRKHLIFNPSYYSNTYSIKANIKWT